MRFGFSFVWVIVACGVVALAFIVGNLALLGLQRHPAEPRKYLAGASADRGRVAFARYGCIGCHMIPGVQNATGRVGPKLEELRHQIYIGGVLANTPENLVRWIRDPKAFSPETVMPDLGVTEQDARDMAAYLYEPTD